jgi:hypothetical protein
VRRCGPRTLLRDALLRFRHADGFTHVRALALQICKGTKAFGATYGPLTAIMALMICANLTAIALFYRLAAAAQLEATRAGGLPPVRIDPGTWRFEIALPLLSPRRGPGPRSPGLVQGECAGYP